MKKAVIVLFLLSGLVAQGQIQTPAPSPGATLTTVVGLTDVKIEYSRPKAKGRKIFGEGNDFVTPYGHIWRTGANNGTIITFGDDVKFGGTDVPKGTYKLFSIPGATQWTVMLYKDLNMGGNDPQGYDQKNEAARASVKVDKLTEKIETFTIEIADLSENSKTANLQLMWENTSVKVPIAVDFDKKVMTSIENNTKVNPNNLFNAAVYYLENGKDLNQALTWVNAAAAANPDGFWITYQKARIQKALGDKKGAMESSMTSKAVAEKAKNADYVKMNDDLMKTLK
ncbi:MAG TPA: DUF2911 domain-containing protein [Cyclobacteriaceae bacterium]|nr:DUF2911 domain-containing protein [Cyclobacteriaceae bacterium]